MILDTIDNLGQYAALNSNIARVIAYIEQQDLNQVATGRQEIDTDQLFGLSFEYETKMPEPAAWEAHRTYIDLHLMIKGSETFYYSNINDERTEITKAYDKEGDYELFDATGDAFVLGEKQFVMLFPQDVHRAGVTTGTAPEQIKKMVFKLKL